MLPSAIKANNADLAVVPMIPSFGCFQKQIFL
jgi:hypothetical protein